MQSLINGAPTFSEFLDSDSINHFEKLKEYLSLSNVAFEVNPRLVRGLDYYNRTVFEWVTQELGAQGAICAGGRYDGLAEQLGGTSTPACGFAIGTERTIELIKVRRSENPYRPIDFYVVRLGELADKYSWKVAEQLRAAGNTGILHVGGGSLASQLRKASASSATFAVIVGDEEVNQGVVSLKPLREAGEQKRVGLQEAITLIKKGEK
jgi:histidyl-tRNA synthetase